MLLDNLVDEMNFSEKAVDNVPVIIFEYDRHTKIEKATPDISNYIAGNYDGRLLSQVMLEDDVIHPNDVKKSLWLRNEIHEGRDGEINIRLKTPLGTYKWFRMTLAESPNPDSDRLIGMFRDIDKEIQLQKNLYYSATVDLTSCIYNKQAFYEATEKLLMSEPNEPHCLVRFDIDRFKIINELYTVTVGDTVLRHVGSILRTLSQPKDTYGRLGNDIFCFCTKRSSKETEKMISQIEEMLNEYPLSFNFHLCAGIVQLASYKNQPANLLCDWAGLAQKTIKGSHIKKFAYYRPALSDALNWEHYIASGMERAMKMGEFLVHLQPQYDMRSGKIIGAEALARWQHPSKGLMPAGQFVPLFEKNGCILQLDAYVWEEVAKIIRRWIDKGVAPIPITVNVSRMHVHDLSFSSKIKDICQSYDVPQSLLELEITESAYVESPQALYDIMDELQKEGSLFLMDDFGSGYSSLNMLKDIPVDIVKIDLNFLQDARRGAEAGRAILKAVVKMIQEIGLPIVVEGVETAEQVDFLVGIGCFLAQGFYFSKPVSVKDFELMFEQ